MADTLVLNGFSIRLELYGTGEIRELAWSKNPKSMREKLRVKFRKALLDNGIQEVGIVVTERNLKDRFQPRKEHQFFDHKQVAPFIDNAYLCRRKS